MVSRGNGDRLEDIASAIAAIGSHLSTGPASDDLVLDAVAMRLGQLGEAVKGLSPAITATEPDVDWTGAAVCAGQALQAHHCFDIWSGALQPPISSRRGRRLT